MLFHGYYKGGDNIMKNKEFNSKYFNRGGAERYINFYNSTGIKK